MPRDHQAFYTPMLDYTGEMIYDSTFDDEEKKNEQIVATIKEMLTI